MAFLPIIAHLPKKVKAKSEILLAFCECFDIPYRTVTEWERGTRNAPDYVLRLLAYYIRMENLVKEKEEKHGEE